MVLYSDEEERLKSVEQQKAETKYKKYEDHYAQFNSEIGNLLKKLNDHGCSVNKLADIVLEDYSMGSITKVGEDGKRLENLRCLLVSYSKRQDIIFKINESVTECLDFFRNK